MSLFKEIYLKILQVGMKSDTFGASEWGEKAYIFRSIRFLAKCGGKGGGGEYTWAKCWMKRKAEIIVRYENCENTNSIPWP